MAQRNDGTLVQGAADGRRRHAWAGWAGGLVACTVWAGFQLSSALAVTSRAPLPPTTGTAAAGLGEPRADLGRLPLNFEANVGQAPADIDYLAHGSSYAIGLGGRGASLSFEGETRQGSAAVAATREVIRLQFAGTRGSVTPTAEAPLPGHVNYLIGSDPSRWRTDVATYAKIRYAGVYPGVDVVYYGNHGHLEYDFAVAAGASASPIRLQFVGADALHLTESGDLKVSKGGRAIAFERPIAYQLTDGKRHAVDVAYRVHGRSVSFELGAYDHSRALVIDPVLSYLSYLGGSSTEVVGGVTGYGAAGITNFTPAAAVDGAGNLYVVGSTYSTNFPTVGGLGAPPSKYNGQSKAWVFVSKIAPDASSLVYSTYLGGSFDDYGNSIAVDSAGSAYVTGSTDSGDFPATTGAFQTVCAPTRSGLTGLEEQNCLTPTGASSGNQWGNAFIAKLNPAGNALVYSTFLGTANTVGEAIAVDGAGRAYVAGYSPANGCVTNPSYFCFPTTSGAVQGDGRGAVGGFSDTAAFVTVVNASGSSLLYSTLYGDKNMSTSHPGFYSIGTAVAVDAAGNFYLAGQTQDGQLPTTSGVLQSAPAPANDSNGDVNGIRAYIAKFSPVTSTGGPTLLYGTYLGGTTAGTADTVSGLAADSAGDAYVYGWTSDNTFPVTAGAYQTTCGTGGAGTCANATYIAKINPTGTKLLWATFFGDATGSGDGVFGTGAIAIDAAGNSYITGIAGQLLAQVNPVQAAAPGGGQAFAAKIDPTGSKLLFSTLIGGGAGAQQGSGIAVDGAGNIYVAGNTNAAGLTTTAGVFQPAFGGTGGSSINQYSGDGFVFKISSVIVPTTTVLTATPDSSVSGTAVSLSATVTPASGKGVPTGTVTFSDGTTVLGTGTLNGTGVGMFTANGLSVGSHAITAVYAGDSGDKTSTSAVVTVTVTAAPPPAPTGLTATAGNAQVALAWTASSGATSYVVYQGTSAGGEGQTAVKTGISGTSATITGLTNGTAYYFTVAAVDAGGTGAASAEAHATPTAPSSGSGGGTTGGGGGGAFDGWALLALTAAAAMRLAGRCHSARGA